VCILRGFVDDIRTKLLLKGTINDKYNLKKIRIETDQKIFQYIHNNLLGYLMDELFKKIEVEHSLQRSRILAPSLQELYEQHLRNWKQHE
jgi:hypothetical protein